jgi:aldose 1-epimerase
VKAQKAPDLVATGPLEPMTGLQHRLVHGDQELVVTEVGATLRAYGVGGRPAMLGFDEDQISTHARGQLLVPWPGRVGDGRYRWGEEDHQLPLDEPALGNAIHGLVRWVNWEGTVHSDGLLVMHHRLHPRDGYPFCLDLVATFELGDAGLEVSQAATNLGDRPAPYGAGAHPYLTVATGAVDDWTLRLPAETVLRTDRRMLPSAREPVRGSEFDFRMARPIGATRLDTPFTDLVRDPDGRVRVSVESAEGRRLVLWADRAFPWLLVFTGDWMQPAERRRGLAVEPMTCPPDALRSGEGVITLEPGETTTGRWGIDVSGFRD